MRRISLITCLSAAALVCGSPQAAFAQAPASPFGGLTTVPPSTFAPTPQPSLPSGGTFGTTPTYSPSASSPFAAAPWDPYAAPGASTVAPPPALAPYGQPAPPSTLGFPFQDWGFGGLGGGPAGPSTRLVQNVQIRNTFISGGGDNDLGIDDLDFNATLAFPILWNMKVAPILFTPGFSFHFFNGPDADPNRDVPGTLYDAFGQFSWRPQFTPRIGADVAVSVGAYSDFSYVNSSSLRVLGRGLGTFTVNERWQAQLGVVYLDRLQVKILPAGGLIWTPHSDARFELLFPQPKLSQRITNWGNAQVWGYVAGEYGGGQWSITHGVGGPHDVINYNDLRLLLGVETFGAGNYRGNFEIGYVFNREIIYRTGVPEFHPDGSFLIRAGLGF
jgi:hypothetical protein